jgi:hypothetical protein
MKYGVKHRGNFDWTELAQPVLDSNVKSLDFLTRQ